MTFRRILVLGGARSGKSAFAERLATECGEPVLYVATATAGDEEMAERIARHRADRPSAWMTVEEPSRIMARVEAAVRESRSVPPPSSESASAAPSPAKRVRPGGRSTSDRRSRSEGRSSSGPTVLVEDLTLLLSNLMAEDMAQAESLAREEVQGLFMLDAHVILVSNEVGMGIVPDHPLGRVFRDALGRLNQQAAAACGEAYLLVAGLPLELK